MFGGHSVIQAVFHDTLLTVFMGALEINIDGWMDR